MNDIQIFENSEFGTIRTITIDGEPWFVGKDVAEALGYSNASKAVINHVDDEDKQFIMFNIADSQNGNVPIGQSKTAFINESGLYALILSSKLPSAKKFKHWVTSEVLPAIRKTGYYGKPSPLPKANNINEIVNLGKFIRSLVADQGATPYQVADAVIDTMKQFDIKLSDKLLLPVKLDAVREDELDMIEFKIAFPESTFQEYLMYRTLLKTSR